MIINKETGEEVSPDEIRDHAHKNKISVMTHIHVDFDARTFGPKYDDPAFVVTGNTIDTQNGMEVAP